MTPNRLNKPEVSDAGGEGQLWQSFKKGSLGAYEQLFNLFYQDLYGYGLKLCSRPELVRDSIQTLFVTIWERKEHLGKVRSVKAYLLASLRRKILKELRKERNINEFLSYQESFAAPVQMSIEESMIRNELAESQKQALLEAFKYLPERQKEILFLKYYNGMSYKEMEEILSINYQSIRNHIHRALQKLRARLKDDISKPVALFLSFALPVLGFLI